MARVQLVRPESSHSQHICLFVIPSFSRERGKKCVFVLATCHVCTWKMHEDHVSYIIGPVRECRQLKTSQTATNSNSRRSKQTFVIQCLSCVSVLSPGNNAFLNTRQSKYLNSNLTAKKREKKEKQGRRKVCGLTHYDKT